VAIIRGYGPRVCKQNRDGADRVAFIKHQMMLAEEPENSVPVFTGGSYARRRGRRGMGCRKSQDGFSDSIVFTT
jgi:hypothetical protein